MTAWVLLHGLTACRIAPPDAEDYEVPTDTEGWSTTTGANSTDGLGTSGMDTEGGVEPTSTGPGTVCGDGIVEGDEDCDDAGPSARCNLDCTAAACGDGIVNAAAGEDCDHGGESSDCDADCTEVICGDGLANAAAGEGCDHGGESPDCDVDCTASQCGDGVFNAAAEELCDEGGATALCDADCTLVECGDGFVNVEATEDCDDMGESETCNSDCSIAWCGDGITNATAGESCDDMGESLLCNLDCSPSWCGDGIPNAAANEDCDDGEESAGCDEDCTTVACGDAHVNAIAGETCDGLVLGGATCQDHGFVGGTLACTPGCAFELGGCANPPGIPVLTLGFSAIKQFDFGWAADAEADYYQLEESAAPGEPFVQLGADIVGNSISMTMPLHLRHEASYRLRACNVVACTASDPVAVTGSLAEAVGYVKASNTDFGDRFGWDVALNGDGTTLAVGAFLEDSNATGIDGDQASNAAGTSGAVYVFVTDGAGQWHQQAYIKASNAGAGDYFGQGVELSDDGNTLVVGAYREDSSATGVGGDQGNNGSPESGAAYVFVRDGLGSWSQQAYLKASNAAPNDRFGQTVALSGDGDTVAVGAYWEDGAATGVDGDQASDGAPASGAAYVFVRDGAGLWSQQAYVKASNTDEDDAFSLGSIDLSDDGDTLVVGTRDEDGGATGIDGDQASELAPASGAAYVFVRDGAGLWTQQAYFKASNAETGDAFGASVALSGDGDTLAVGAEFEDGNAAGIDGDQTSNSVGNSGAVYVFMRDGIGQWTQQAYVKASNPGTSDQLGASLELSGNGSVLVVGAQSEDGNATGIGGDQGNDAAAGSGATYVFVRNGQWSQQAYLKASNAAAGDRFGVHVALSGDGLTVAVGADFEDGASTGIGGDRASDAVTESGAVYLY